MTTQAMPSRVAVHEAGHAAVKIALGFRVDEVVALPDEERGSLGHVRGEARIGQFMNSVEPSWLDMLAAGQSEEEVAALMEEWDKAHGDDIPGSAADCVAGEVAERIAFGSAEEETLGRDREQLADICLHVSSDDDVHQQIQADAYALAEQILRERWPGVLALAHELEQRGTMSGTEAEAAMANAPSTT